MHSRKNVLVTGISCSGKTTLARKIAKNIALKYISAGDIIHKIAKDLLGYVPRRTVSTHPDSSKVHSLARELMRKILSEGGFVIDDHIFLRGPENTIINPPPDYFNLYNISCAIVIIPDIVLHKKCCQDRGIPVELDLLEMTRQFCKMHVPTIEINQRNINRDKTYYKIISFLKNNL